MTNSASFVPLLAIHPTHCANLIASVFHIKSLGGRTPAQSVDLQALD